MMFSSNIFSALKNIAAIITSIILSTVVGIQFLLSGSDGTAAALEAITLLFIIVSVAVLLLSLTSSRSSLFRYLNSVWVFIVGILGSFITLIPAVIIPLESGFIPDAILIGFLTFFLSLDFFGMINYLISSICRR